MNFPLHFGEPLRGTLAELAHPDVRGVIPWPRGEQDRYLTVMHRRGDFIRTHASIWSRVNVSQKKMPYCEREPGLHVGRVGGHESLVHLKGRLERSAPARTG